MTHDEIRQAEYCMDSTHMYVTLSRDDRGFVFTLISRPETHLTDDDRMRLNRIAGKLGV